MLQTIPLPSSNYLITYYETLDEATWLLRQKKTIKYKHLEKNLKKIANLIKKIIKFEVKLLKTNLLKLTTMQ